MHPFRAAVEAGQFDTIDRILAEDVVMHSPIAHRRGWPRRLVPSDLSATDTGRGAPYPASDKTAQERCMMAWLVLTASGVLESVWATALNKSDGFSRVLPTLVFAVALVFSMAGLAFAMRSLPTGTSYAVWVGVGAVLTVGYAMLTGDETASPLKPVLIAGVVGCIVGLKLVS